MKIIYPNKEEEKQINQGIRNDPDAPEWTDDMFRRAVRGLQKAPLKKRITIRLDPDVVDWFKEQGTGYQSRMNDVLRQHIEHTENP